MPTRRKKQKGACYCWGLCLAFVFLAKSGLGGGRPKRMRGGGISHAWATLGCWSGVRSGESVAKFNTKKAEMHKHP
jgi:hypothetical protein